MTSELVISRYKESLGWLKLLPQNLFDEVTVYNKGPHVDSKYAKVIERPNAGREGETYLNHIYMHYDGGLADRVVFLQADPFEHSPDILRLLNRISDFWEVQSLSYCWQLPYRKGKLGSGMYQLGYPSFEILPRWKDPNDNLKDLRVSTFKFVEREFSFGPSMVSKGWWPALSVFRERWAPDSIDVYANLCGLFSADRDQIISRNKEDYQDIRRWLLNCKMEKRSRMGRGIILEFLWLNILGYEDVFRRH